MVDQTLAFNLLWKGAAAEQGLRKLGSEASDAKKKVDALGTGPAKKNLQDLGNAADTSAGKVDKLGSKSAEAMEEARGKAKAFGLGVGAAAAAAVGFGIKVAAGNEQARISFTTMLGSAEKADVFLKQLQQFAATTPFEFPELQEASSSLISAGVQASKVIPIMRSLGDVTAGMGTGADGVKRATVALQQMSAAGKITGEDLNQLRDAGVPVFDLLAAATGKTKEEVAGLAQAGKLGKQELEQLMSALESGKGLERFSGLMDKQSKSLEGMVSTLKDVTSQGLATALDPMLPTIKSVLEGLTNLAGFVTGHLNLFAPLALAVGGVTGTVIVGKKAIEGWRTAVAVSESVATGAVKGIDALRVAFGGVEMSAKASARAMKLAQFAIPGIGIALFAVTTAFEIFGKNSDSGKQAAEGFSQAMQGVEGQVNLATAALDKNVRQQAVMAMQSSGALDAAEKLGINLGTLTDAALGGEDAIQKVNDAIRAGYKGTSDQVQAAGELGGKMKDITAAATEQARVEQQRRAALADSVAPTKTLAQLTGDLGNKSAALAAEVQKVINKFTILRDGALGAEQANSAFEDSLDSMTDAVRSNRSALDEQVKAGKLSKEQADRLSSSLSVNTERGRANRAAVLGMASALNDKVTAAFKSTWERTKDFDKATAAATDTLRAGEKQMGKSARAAGLNEDAYDGMIKKMVKTPKELETELKTANLKKFLGDVDNAQQAIADVKGKSVDIKVNYKSSGSVLGASGASLIKNRRDGGEIGGFGTTRQDNIAGIDRATGVQTTWVSAKEYVTNAHQYSKNKDAVQKINAGGLWDVVPRGQGGPARLANGGPVTVRDLVAAFGAGAVPNFQGQINTRASRAEDQASDAAMRTASAVVRGAKKRRAAEAAGGEGGPIGKGGYSKALAWLKRNEGHPYVYATIWDCSGIVGAAHSIIRGESPHRRYATPAFYGSKAQGFTRGKKSPLMIAVNPNPGKSGHMVGQLNGVPFEEAGGVGLRVGGNARRLSNPMFSWRGGLARGGAVGDLPYDLIDPRGERYNPALRDMVMARPHQSGGLVSKPSLVPMAENGPERILSPRQTSAFERMVRVMDSGSTTTYAPTYNFPNYLGTTQQLRDTIVQLDEGRQLEQLRRRR